MSIQYFVYKLKENLFVVSTILAAALVFFLQLFQASSKLIAATAIVSYVLIILKEIKDNNKADVESVERKLTSDKLNKIEDEVVKKNVVLQDKQKIIAEFLRRGVVKEDDLIKSLNQETFITVYHFNRKIGELKKYFPDEKLPFIRLLEFLGFLPVGFAYGGYFYHVTEVNSLPTSLQNIVYLEAYIKKKMKESWKVFWSDLKVKNKRLYHQYKNKKIFNLSYLIAKCFPADLRVGYVNFSSFDKRFLTFYSKSLDSKKLKINHQNLSNLLRMASISLFLDSIPYADRGKIVKKENKIKNMLGITSLLDFERISEKEWIEALSVAVKDNKRIKYAEEIRSSTIRYCSIIKEFI